MLAGVPLTFTLDLDAGAVDEEVQRAGSSTVRQANVERSLTAAQGTEIRNGPVQPDKPQKACNKACCLPQWHSEQHFLRRTSLDRGIAELLLPTTLAGRRRHPDHLWIKPDRERSTPPLAVIVGRPVSRLVFRTGPATHNPRLSYWIHAVNPSRDLRNKAPRS